MADDDPPGPGTTVDAGDEDAWERRRATFAMGEVVWRRADELHLGDLVWHPATLLYRPLLEIRYSFDARWELRLHGGQSRWVPDRCARRPDEVEVLVGAGIEYLRRSNNGLGADGPPATGPGVTG